MGITTVVTSGKGGVGKSTITANLGIALAQKGRKVLLIDGDAGLRSLDFMLGISEALVYDISDAVSGNCEIVKAIYQSPFHHNLFLLPAPQKVDYRISPGVMRQLISLLSRYYHHILIDCPAGIGRGFKSAVAPADRAIVVTNPEPICLRDSDKVRKIIESISDHCELRLVINRFCKSLFKKSKMYEDLDCVIDAAGIQLLAVIPEDQQLRIIASRGNVLISEKSPAILAFRRMAARIEGEREELFPFKKL